MEEEVGVVVAEGGDVDDLSDKENLEEVLELILQQD